MDNSYIAPGFRSLLTFRNVPDTTEVIAIDTIEEFRLIVACGVPPIESVSDGRKMKFIFPKEDARKPLESMQVAKTGATTEPLKVDYLMLLHAEEVWKTSLMMIKNYA